MERTVTISIRYLVFLVIISLLIAPFKIMGQKVTVSEGSYTLCITENMSIAEAKHLALKNAKIKAIEEAFGTGISQLNRTTIKTTGMDSNVDFRSDAESFVKGEWIETLETPVFKTDLDASDNMWITCSVKGRVREVVSSNVNVDAKILRNGTDFKFESCDFKDGDDMYLYVNSSMDINVSVYFVDEKSGLVYRIFPYIGSLIQSYHITENSPEVFFSRALASIDFRNIVDEYQLICEDDVEFYEICLLYSTNSLPSPFISQGDGLAPSIPIIEFERWLAQTRLRDVDIKTINLGITVRGRK